jgi:hypothetical protein
MNASLLNSASLLADIVESRHSHYPRAHAERLLSNDAILLRADIKKSPLALKQTPEYVALAFRGPLQFSDTAPIKERLNRNDFEVCFQEIRALRCVKLAAEAKPAWDALAETAPALLWIALACNSGVISRAQFDNNSEYEDEEEEDSSENEDCSTEDSPISSAE